MSEATELKRVTHETALALQQQAELSLKIAVLYREAALTAFSEGKHGLGETFLLDAEMHHRTCNQFNRAAAVCSQIADE